MQWYCTPKLLNLKSFTHFQGIASQASLSVVAGFNNAASMSTQATSAANLAAVVAAVGNGGGGNLSASTSGSFDQQLYSASGMPADRSVPSEIAIFLV